jgi:uncharacterized membrane protein YeaQ/YmgE (transglycosylase-associated protein family)
MGIIAWIVFGFIIGLLARAIVPGRQSMGFIMTTLLGVAGSLIGGFIANSLSGGTMQDVHGAGFIGSLIGAVVLVFIVSAATSGRRRAAV